jgi:hypothetical protein
MQNHDQQANHPIINFTNGMHQHLTKNSREMEREKRNNPLLKKFNDKENIINEKKSTSSTRTTNPNLQTIAESQQTT